MVLGRGGFSGWADLVPLASFIFFVLFSFSFSVFPISFIQFAKMLQMTSNQLLKLSKVQRSPFK
jgi:hypothetical protein